jgi:DNA-binding winged helix-turn-helix (wHTH) protein/TolB-like protein
MNPGHTGPLRFGNFEFDPVSGELRKHGLAVRITPQARALLRILLESPLRVHAREKIQRHLWPEQRFLDFEHGLNKVVHSLRDALGDSGTNPRFIETIAGSGYRFVPEWIQSFSFAVNVVKVGAEPGYSIAVLPLSVSGTLSGYRFRSGRMTTDLSDALSSIPGLRILAQTMVKSRYTLGASPQSVGFSMGVRAVLSGELILRETALYLRMELIDVHDGAQLSVARVERPYISGQQIEEDIGDEVFRQLRPVLLSLGEPAASAIRN